MTSSNAVVSLDEFLASVAPIAGVTADSRQVKAGWIFVATKGGTHDGHAFLEQAARAGAAALVGEGEPPEELAGLETPYLRVQDSRETLGLIASAFEGHPSRRLRMVGVTGTSGKTTTTYLIEAVLKAAGCKVGVIGTVSFRFGDKVYPSTHTTPGAPELQRLLREMADDGCTAVVMEVSSHALKQRRVAGIGFAAAAFTNLTPEHLDFHPDMEDYFRSKTMLFAPGPDGSPVAVVNADDAYGARLLAELRARKPAVRAIGFGIAAKGADLDGSGLKAGLEGVAGELDGPLGKGIGIRSPLVGGFNAANALAAVGVGLGLGIDGAAIARGIASAASVPGRLERVPHPDVNVFVDYAHKPDALEKVVEVLRGVRGQGRLITVFGCGGDRDRAKRPVMGGLAVKGSDLVVVTSDNPRTEDPAAIIAEIVKGIEAAPAPKAPHRVEPDRAKAIAWAIAEARPGDIVLIAGKGHEDYQIIGAPDGGTRKIRFDDREQAAAALKAR